VKTKAGIKGKLTRGKVEILGKRDSGGAGGRTSYGLVLRNKILLRGRKLEKLKRVVSERGTVKNLRNA